MRRHSASSPGSNCSSAHASCVRDGPTGTSIPKDRLARWMGAATTTHPRRSRRSAGVIDAVTRRGHGLEPRVGDGIAADLALAITTVVELVEGPLHIAELVAQPVGQPLGFPLLRSHLAAVGEVLVERQRVL